MDEEKHYFHRYKLITSIIFNINHNYNYLNHHNNNEILRSCSINDLELFIQSDYIFFNIKKNSQDILYVGKLIRMSNDFEMYYQTSVITIFPNVSNDQWLDLINNNFELIQNIIESYFNELIKSETMVNLEKYDARM